MFASQSFPARPQPSRRAQAADNSVSERVDAFRRSNGRPRQNIRTPNPDPVPAPTRPFPWVQNVVPDITISMRDEKFKWWNAPPKTDEESKAEAARTGKFEFHVPSVEGLDSNAPFLSPSRDALRSFRNHPHPWGQTKAQNDATGLRDRKFKQYNSRPAQASPPITSYSSQYLDHDTQGAIPGAQEPCMDCPDDGTAWSDFLHDARDWIGNWIGYLVLVLAFLYFGMGPMFKIFKPVLSFLSRGGVAPSLLFFYFLFLLIR